MVEGFRLSTLNGNDEILLLAVQALGEDAYGAVIMQHLSRITKKEWSIGAIYDPLHRMEKKGLVESVLTAPTPERGGRSKRVYRVTGAGREALRRHGEVREAVARSARGLVPGSGVK
jgi:DNA-binding PadR family transcriptional regulator